MYTVISIQVPVDRGHVLIDSIAEFAMDEAEKYGFDAFVLSETTTDE